MKGCLNVQVRNQDDLRFYHGSILNLDLVSNLQQEFTKKGKGKVKKTEKEINIVQNLDDFSENNVYCVGIMWRTLCGTAH